MAYPVTVEVAPALAGRNRLTVAVRLILAIPHVILVGGLGLGGASASNGDGTASGGSETGLLGVVAIVMAIISWVTILIAGQHLPGIRQFTAYYLRWRVRALSYLMLLADPYPPFGDGPYPASLEVVDPIGPRDRLTVAVRLLLVLPHLLVLLFIQLLWVIVTIVGWFVIVLSGTFPEAFHRLGTGTLRWRMRVEAYALLMVDDYPPFSFD